MVHYPLAALQMAMATQNHNILPMTVQLGITASSNIHVCPQQGEIQATINNIHNDISDTVQAIHSVPNCGDGLWYRVAHLNMSDPSQHCPSAWRQVTIDGKRVCARPNTTAGSCPSTVYPAINYQYRKVCGRVIGYQFGSPSAFYLDSNGANNQPGLVTINEVYLDGVSITRGIPRIHIWSYAAGASENGSCTFATCPCSNGDWAPPSFVGENYYCESAYRGNCYLLDTFFSDDPLWDGQQCEYEGTCCTGANTPPWFSVSLNGTTSNDIEVRICHNQDTADEDTSVQLLELYVQ